MGRRLPPRRSRPSSASRTPTSAAPATPTWATSCWCRRSGRVQLDPGHRRRPRLRLPLALLARDASAPSPGYYAVRARRPRDRGRADRDRRASGCTATPSRRADQAHVVLDLVSSIYDYDGKVLWSRAARRGRHAGSPATRHHQGLGTRPRALLRPGVLEAVPLLDGWSTSTEETYLGFGPGRERVLASYARSVRAQAQGTLRLQDHGRGRGDPGQGGDLARSASTARSATCEAEVPGWDFDGVRPRRARDLDSRARSRPVEADASRPGASSTPRSTTPCWRRSRTWTPTAATAGSTARSTSPTASRPLPHLLAVGHLPRAPPAGSPCLQPERDGEMIRSMLAHRRQSVHGILPVWSFGGARDLVHDRLSRRAGDRRRLLEGHPRLRRRRRLRGDGGERHLRPLRRPRRLPEARLRADRPREGRRLEDPRVRLRRLDHRAHGGGARPRRGGARVPPPRRELPRHLRPRHRLHARAAAATARSASRSIRCTRSTAATTPRATPGSTPGSCPTTSPR